MKTDQFVTNCVDIAVHHGFQGWLVNIENVVREDLVPALIDMLAKVVDKDMNKKRVKIHPSLDKVHMVPESLQSGFDTQFWYIYVS